MMPINHHLDPLERSGIRVFTNLAKATPDCRMLTIGEPDQASKLPSPVWSVLRPDRKSVV